MDKEKVTIIATGELSLSQRDSVLRFLGRQGLSTEVRVDSTAEQARSRGYATRQDLSSFFAADDRYQDTSHFDTRLWHILLRVSKANYSNELLASKQIDPELRGKVPIDGKYVELFKVLSNAGTDVNAARYTGKTAFRYELNLGTLETMLERGMIRSLPNVGKKIEGFAKDFIEYQKSLIAADGHSENT